MPYFCDLVDSAGDLFALRVFLSRGFGERFFGFLFCVFFGFLFSFLCGCLFWFFGLALEAVLGLLFACFLSVFLFYRAFLVSGFGSVGRPGFFWLDAFFFVFCPLFVFLYVFLFPPVDLVSLCVFFWIFLPLVRMSISRFSYPGAVFVDLVGPLFSFSVFLGLVVFFGVPVGSSVLLSFVFGGFLVLCSVASWTGLRFEKKPFGSFLFVFYFYCVLAVLGVFVSSIISGTF